MNADFLRGLLRPGVYYISLLLLAAVTAASGVEAQVDLTVAPTMTKGPSDAPVTIVEFSDYQ